MPIITTLLMMRPLSFSSASRSAAASRAAPSRLFASHSWPMISPAVRLRLKPCLPVEQKAQSSAQPACEEMHSVPRLVSGMNTVSTALALPTSSSHLRVPSLDTESRTGTGGRITAMSLSFARNDLATSVIWSKSLQPSRCIQRITWRARKGFSPSPANQATRPSTSKSSRLTGIFMFASNANGPPARFAVKLPRSGRDGPSGWTAQRE